MRRLDDDPIDPEIAAELDAIDATLAGEPVDPQHAELAELALLLAATRPRARAASSPRSLDERVRTPVRARRRRPRPAGRRELAVSGLVRAGGGTWPPGWRRWRWRSSSLGSVAAASSSGASSTCAHRDPDLRRAVFVGRRGRPLRRRVAGAPADPEAHAERASRRSSGARRSAPAAVRRRSRARRRLPNGRKIIQSAQLALTAPPSHIDAVAQEVFDVVGRENGIVNSSTVTAEHPAATPSSS